MELTVATWNIRGQSPGHEQRRPGIGPVLEAVGADLVGLVEVWRDGARLQIEELATELGYPHSAYADVYAGTGELPWGVGILSRFPIEAQQRLEFPNPVTPIVGDEYNGAALVATVRLPADRAIAPIVIEFAHGSQGGWTSDGLANPNLRRRPFGRHRIDYVLTGAGEPIPRLWRANGATVFGKDNGPNGAPPSDHYGVRGELELAELIPGVRENSV